MHELSVTQSVLDIAIRYAQEGGSVRITDLHLVIGQFSSIIDDSVQFYWDIISKGTIAEGSRLHFRRVAAEMLCQSCDCRYAPGNDAFACPSCGSLNVEVVAGDEFYLDTIDVETNNSTELNSQGILT